MKKKEIEVSGKKFNMLEIITFGSTILTVIACFLPFISMGYYSVSLMDAGKDAIIFIISFFPISLNVEPEAFLINSSLC